MAVLNSRRATPHDALHQAITRTTVCCVNFFPAPGIFFRKKKMPRSEKLASLGVWRLRPDWTEVQVRHDAMGRA